MSGTPLPAGANNPAPDSRTVNYTPRIFLIFASFFGLIYLLLIPPNQVLDELAHTIRAYGVSYGHCVPDLLTPVPEPVMQMMDTFRNADDPAAGKLWITPEDVSFWLKKTANQRRMVDRPAPSTNIYSCVAYLPGAAAFAMGRAVELPPLALFDIARLANLIVFLALVGIALRIVPDFRLPLLALAIMPMTLVQAASLSEDSVAFALSFLLLACIARVAFDERIAVVGWRETAMVTALAAAAYLAKTNVLPLALLAFLAPRRKFATAFRRVAFVAFPLVLSAAAWLLWRYVDAGNLHAYVGADRLARNTDMQANALWLLTHPVLFLDDVKRSLGVMGTLYLQMFVGSIGWAGLTLPLGLALLYVCWLLVCSAGQKTRVNLQRWQRAVLASVSLGGILMTFAIIFIVGAQAPYIHSPRPEVRPIAGVQGRYLIPLALPLLMALAGIGNRLPARLVTALLILLAAVSNGLAVEMTWSHFYQNARLRRLDGQLLSADGEIYLASGGELHRIPDAITVKSLDADTRSMPPSAPPAMPRGSPFPRLETSMVRRDSSGEVFFIRGACLHYIPDRQTLTILGLEEQIHNLPASVVDMIPRCSPLPREQFPAVTSSDSRMFVTWRGERHAIPDVATLEVLHIAPEQMSVSPLDASLPVGSPLPPLGTRALRRLSTGEVFFVDNACLHPALDPKNVPALKPPDQIADVPDNVLASFPVCPAVADSAGTLVAR